MPIPGNLKSGDTLFCISESMDTMNQGTEKRRDTNLKLLTWTMGILLIRGREPRAPIKCRALQRSGNLNCCSVKKEIMDCKNRALNVEQIEMLLAFISSLKPYQQMYDQD
ncbi:unnamed protein product [Porites lobata]|uniref:Uncharacterized protein n=1 Tax=Porites lobata TaxID=104759 RepID=A0ABN8N0X3_9CNID|nr:unnamed protein product [Porites lobata]